MTFGEAHERIDVIIDKHDLPWFEPEEKDVFLELAQNEFIKTRYAEFELNEKRRQDLRTLIATSTGAGSTVTVPADMWFVLSLKGTFSVTSGNSQVTQEVAIRPIQHDDINKTLNDPFNKPSNNLPSYITNASSFSIVSGSAPSAWTLTYLKTASKPDGESNPSQSFELPIHTHDEILNIAIRKMLFSIDKDTYQLQLNEILNQE